MWERLVAIREGLRDEDLRAISRRYFISNGFDGTRTGIGIIVGAYLTGVTDGLTVVTIGGRSGSARPDCGASGRSSAPRSRPN